MNAIENEKPEQQISIGGTKVSENWTKWNRKRKIAPIGEIADSDKQWERGYYHGKDSDEQHEYSKNGRRVAGGNLRGRRRSRRRRRPGLLILLLLMMIHGDCRERNGSRHLFWFISRFPSTLWRVHLYGRPFLFIWTAFSFSFFPRSISCFLNKPRI